MIPSEIELPAPTPAPVVAFDLGELQDRSWTEAVQIEVRAPESLLGAKKTPPRAARFWVSVSMDNGRPKVSITTKPNLNDDKQVSKRVKGTLKPLKGTP